MKKKILPLLLLFSFFLTSGFGCKMVDKKTQEAMKPVTLNYWRVWDGPDAFEEIIANYKAQHPYVTINYRKFRYNEYEKELLEALAEDRGPDILSIHNTWIPKYQSKLAAMPAETSMVTPVTKGTIKKEVVNQLNSKKSLSLKDLKNNYIDTVYEDVVLKTKNESGKFQEAVYGLPLSVDTLALYYNKDLFNNSGVIEPPAYWDKDFQQNVKKLTKQDSQGQIIQSGAALGGSMNIERYSDILSVLMMQNGAQMVDDNNNASFDSVPSRFREQNYNPGLDALRFYTDFSNPSKEVYSWNKNLDNSLSMFSAGKLAMMFGYSYYLPTIRAQAPKLNFALAPLPQIEGNGNVNFANYWVESVSNKSKYINEAWDFIQFETKAEQAKSYLTATKKPAALRSLIKEQTEDEDLSVFANQLLTAKSWYHGVDANAAELIIGEMIDLAVSGQGKLDDIIELAANKIQQTMVK